MVIMEKIEKAASQYVNENASIPCSLSTVRSGFIQGVISEEAKDYWFTKFKQERFFSQNVFPPEIEPIVFLDGSTAKPLIGYLSPNSQEDEEVRQSHRRIGIVGLHGATLIGAGRIHGEAHLEEMMISAKERGIIIVGDGDLECELLKGSSQIHEFIRRPEILMPRPNVEEFTITANNYDCSTIFEEKKSWDRKYQSGKMNTYKSKKRNKR